MQVLPDILHYDRTRPATYPNGRILTDDVYSMRFAWLTNGKVPPTGLKPHDDLLAPVPLPRPAEPQPLRRLLRAGDGTRIQSPARRSAKLHLTDPVSDSRKTPTVAGPSP